MIGLALDENFNNDILRGWKMPGVFEVPRTLSISAAIEDLLLIAECSLPGEWGGQVRYLPLR